jgi:hypothetical protein
MSKIFEALQYAETERIQLEKMARQLPAQPQQIRKRRDLNWLLSSFRLVPTGPHATVTNTAIVFGDSASRMLFCDGLDSTLGSALSVAVGFIGCAVFRKQHLALRSHDALKALLRPHPVVS